MATVVVDPSGTTTPDDWALQAGASKAAAVTQPSDDDLSYIRSGGSLVTQYFTFFPGLTSGDVINGVRIDVRCRRGGVSDGNFKVGYAFTPLGGGSQTNEIASGPTATSGWQNFFYEDTGLSVAWGSNFVAWIRNTQTRAVDCTTMVVTLTYTPVATGEGQPMMARGRLVPGMRRPHGQQGW